MFGATRPDSVFHSFLLFPVPSRADLLFCDKWGPAFDLGLSLAQVVSVVVILPPFLGQYHCLFNTATPLFCVQLCPRTLFQPPQVFDPQSGPFTPFLSPALVERFPRISPFPRPAPKVPSPPPTCFFPRIRFSFFAPVTNFTFLHAFAPLSPRQLFETVLKGAFFC